MGILLDILDFFADVYTTKCCGTCIHYESNEDGYRFGKCDMCFCHYVDYDDGPCVSYITKFF